MSAIHYKLKSAKDYDTYRFEGSGIPVWELKNEIIEKKKLGKSDDFDLVILNAQTNEEYPEDNSIIPRNTSVIVKRVPAPKGRVKKPSDRANNTFVNPSILASSRQQAQTAAATPVGSKDEDAKISKIVGESTSHWVNQQQQQQTTTQQMPMRKTFKPKGPAPVPPPSYTCFRCGQPGHYINYCPTNDDPTFDRPRIKKTTGIPRAFLKTVDVSQLEGSSIMVTSEGAAVVATPNMVEWERVTAERQRSFQDIPKDLVCPICKDLLTNPMRLGCCQAVCCEQCIHDALMDDTVPQCPLCSKQTSIKALTVPEDILSALKEYQASFNKHPEPPVDQKADETAKEQSTMFREHDRRSRFDRTSDRINDHDRTDRINMDHDTRQSRHRSQSPRRHGTMRR